MMETLKGLWRGIGRSPDRQYFLQIAKLLPGVYYRIELEPEYRIRFVGEGIADLVGYTAKELMNTNTTTYFRTVHPEFEEILSRKKSLCRQGPDASRLQYHVFTKSRTAKRIDDHFIGEHDKTGRLVAITGYFREAKSSSVRLQLLHQLEAYRAAIDVSILSSITDANGTIIYANENFRKVSQYTEAELLGRNHRIIKSDRHQKSFFEGMWKTISSGKMWSGQIQNRAKDGSLYWVDTVIIPVFDENHTITTYLSLRLLITDRKRAEEQRDRYTRTLEDIAHIVAHDLRGPVCTILGLAHLMNKTSVRPEDAQSAIQHLLNAANRLDVITRELSSRIYAADREVNENCFNNIPNVN